MSKRVVSPEKTIENVERYFSDVGFEYELSYDNIDDLDLFWSAEIDIKDRKYNTTFGGKGTSKIKATCSLYGEVIERISRIAQEEEESFKIYDLVGSEQLLIKKEFGNFDITDNLWCAAGNTYHEAILHALYEVFEDRFSHQNNELYPELKCIANTEEMFDWPQYIHDSFVFFVQRDYRFPVYAVRSLKYPDRDTPYLGYERSGDRLIFKNEITSRYNTSGLRIDSSVKEAITGAMGENFQKYREYDDRTSTLNKNPKKKKTAPIAEYKEFDSFSRDEIEEELAAVINSMVPYSTFIGAIDLTMLNSPLKVVKIVTDFNINHSLDSSNNLKNFFEF